MSKGIGGPRFGEPVRPEDVLKRIAAECVAYDFGNPESATEAANYYYGRWNAMICAFNLVGELMDRPTKESLHQRLMQCHALAQQHQGMTQDPHVVEAGNYFLLLATAVHMDLEDNS